MKTCNTCKIEKSLEFFSKKTSSKDGLNHRCKACDKVKVSQWRAENPEKAKAGTIRWNTTNHAHVRARQKAYYNKNAQQIMDQMKDFLVNNPEKGLLKMAKSRAKLANLPFSITEKDIQIPEFCPILGVRLEFGTMSERDSSPSLDRFLPEKGYVPGNVVVISYRANRIKNDGTSNELRKLAAWMDSFGTPQ